MHTVLLLVDLINHSFDSDDSKNLPKKKDALTQKIKGLIGIAKKKDWQIIWVREQYKADLSDMPRLRKKKLQKKKSEHEARGGKKEDEPRVPIEGKKAAKFLEELEYQPEEGDTVTKTNYSAFFGTTLDKVMEREAKGERYFRIILAGVNTQACIQATAMDAFHRDHEVIFAEDCIASYNGIFHEVFLAYQKQSIGKLLSNEEIAAERFSDSETVGSGNPYDSYIP